MWPSFSYYVALAKRTCMPALEDNWYHYAYKFAKNDYLVDTEFKPHMTIIWYPNMGVKNYELHIHIMNHILALMTKRSHVHSCVILFTVYATHNCCTDNLLFPWTQSLVMVSTNNTHDNIRENTFPVLSLWTCAINQLTAGQYLFRRSTAVLQPCYYYTPCNCLSWLMSVTCTMPVTLPTGYSKHASNLVYVN